VTTINLKGVWRIPRVYPGSVRVDFYAWRGNKAPRIGSYQAASIPEADALAEADAAGLATRYAEAVARPHVSPGGFVSVIHAYKASPEFTRLSPATLKVWRRFLDLIEDEFGQRSIRSMSAPSARAVFLAWRDTFKETPRTADYAMQVLSRLLSWGVDRGLVEINRAAGIGKLWEADLSDDIWEPAHIARFDKEARKQEREYLLHAVLLLAHTGLRAGDAAALQWSAVNLKAGEIRWRTSKSRRRAEAVVPITPALRALLKEIPRTGETVLVSGHGKPFSTGGTLSEAIQKIAEKAKVDRRTHDLRGTAATLYASAGLSASQIARILGWSEKQAERIIDRYVNPGRVSRMLAGRMKKAQAVTGGVTGGG
jgi:integrase